MALQSVSAPPSDSFTLVFFAVNICMMGIYRLGRLCGRENIMVWLSTNTGAFKTDLWGAFRADSKGGFCRFVFFHLLLPFCCFRSPFLYFLLHPLPLVLLEMSVSGSETLEIKPRTCWRHHPHHFPGFLFLQLLFLLPLLLLHHPPPLLSLLLQPLQLDLSVLLLLLHLLQLLALCIVPPPLQLLQLPLSLFFLHIIRAGRWSCIPEHKSTKSNWIFLVCGCFFGEVWPFETVPQSLLCFPQFILKRRNVLFGHFKLKKEGEK